MDPYQQRDRKAAIIAAAITFVAALVILVLLFVLSVGSDDRRMMSEVSVPEMQDDEEIFLEPELLDMSEPGDELTEEDIQEEEAAPQPPGEPDPAEVEQPQRVVKNEVPPEEPPVSNKPKLVSTKEPSDVKTSTPKLSAEEEKRIAAIGGKLKTDNNGSRTGNESAETGNGQAGMSSQGNLNGDKGRKMLSCPTSRPTLNRDYTIRVSVQVTADGNVKSASLANSGGAPANLTSLCVDLAKKSKWTPKADAPIATGTIVFSLKLKR